MRNETLAMINELGLTTDELVKLTKYTEQHIERYEWQKSS